MRDRLRKQEYEHKGGKYFAGAAVHTRQYPINEDGEMVSADESQNAEQNSKHDAGRHAVGHDVPVGSFGFGADLISFRTLCL